MGNYPKISGVTGYDNQVPIITRKVKAGGTIAAGNVVCWGDSGDSVAAADYGLSVVACGAAQIPCGVALQAASAGDYIDIQTRGPNAVAMVMGVSDYTAGNAAYALADAKVNDAGNQLMGDGNTGLRRVGVFLDTATGDAVAVGDLFIACPAGW